MVNMGSSVRRPLKWIAKLAVSLTLFGLFLFSVNLGQVTERICSINVGALVLASLVILISIIIRAYRWQVISMVYGTTLSLWTSFRLIQMGNFVGQVLPSTIGGDVARAWGGCRSGMTMRISIHTILLDRLFGLGALLIIILFSMPGLFFLINETVMLLVLSGVALSGVLVLSGVIFLDKPPVWLPWKKMRQEIDLLSSDARKFIANWRASVPVFFASVASHLIFIVAVMVLARGIGVKVHLYELVLLLPSVIFLALMPFSLAGWGVREGAMVFTLGYIGVARESAFAISVLMGIVAMMTSLPGGIFMIMNLYRRRSVNKNI